MSAVEYCIQSVFPESSKLESEEAIIEIINWREVDNKTKIDYLSNQMNKINLSDVEKEFWDVALDSNVIKPTWTNIEKYASIEEITALNFTLVEFIRVNCNEISLQKTVGILSDETENNLFENLIGSDLLSIEAYKQIRNSFNRCFENYDLSSIGEERMQVLIDTKGLKFNNYNYEMVKENFPTLSASFILINKLVFLSDIEPYTFSSDVANILLNSNKLTQSEKSQIIQFISSTGFEITTILSNSISSILISSSKILVSNEFILILLKNATDQNLKFSLFVKRCVGSTYDESFVKNGLILLGGDYAIIASQRGHRRKLSPTSENKELARFLEKNRFISKQFEEEGMIKINARKQS